MTVETRTALSTLGGETALLIPGPTMTRGGGILSIRGTASVHSLTAGDGPFLFGIMNKDLTQNELEEYLELNGPVHPDDTTAVETTSRGKKIRSLGIIFPLGNGTVAALQYLKDVSLSGLRFSEEAAGFSFWIYNLGGSLTTGSFLTIVMQLFLRWNRSG